MESWDWDDRLRCWRPVRRRKHLRPARLTRTAEFAAAPQMRSVGKPIGGAGDRVAGQSKTQLQPGESVPENRIDGIGALVGSPPRELKSTRWDGVGALDLN